MAALSTRWPARRPTRTTTAGVVAVLLVLLATLVVLAGRDDGPPPLTQADVDAAVRVGVEAAREEDAAAPADAAVAWAAVSPSLVSVTATRAGGVSRGAGTVVNADGSVLTARHVVDGASSVALRFADGTTTTARVAESDPATDIAVLAPAALPGVVVPATLGGSAGVGDPVFAVGDPFGLAGSLSAGVVSATGRDVRSEDAALTDLIQFDAAVNPGNSGGPLVDPAGQVVGVVTAVANPTGQAFFVGLGFAVPVATAGGVAGGPQQ